MRSKISIVVPAFNEALSLPVLIEDVSRILDGLPHDFELIVIDDGSSDNTWEVLRNCSRRWTQLRAFHFTRNFGKESAIYAGLKVASGEAVIVMDADLQHPADLLPKMINLWETTKVLLVEAVKERRQKESSVRALGSRFFYRVFFASTGIDLKDSSDYKLLDRKVVDEYLSLPENARFFRGLTRWFGYASCLLQYAPTDRFGEKSKSRWTIRNLVHYGRGSLLSFTSFPIRLVTWLGLATLVVSVFLGVQTLWIKICGRAVEGFTTVILVNLGIGSVIMLSLGIIGEYLARIYDEIKNRPRYIIDATLEGKKDN